MLVYRAGAGGLLIESIGPSGDCWLGGRTAFAINGFDRLCEWDCRLAPGGDAMPYGPGYAPWLSSYGGGGREVPSPAVGELVLCLINDVDNGENIDLGGGKSGLGCQPWGVSPV